MSTEVFRWDNVPAPVLAALADELDLDRDGAAEALRAAFGTTPRTAFVRAAWPVLRDVWLAGDPDVRGGVVAGLRAAGLGDESIGGDAEYLSSCANTSELRSVVLAAFLGVGRQPNRGASVAASAGGVQEASATTASSPEVVEIETLEALEQATEMVLATLEGDGDTVGRSKDGDMVIAHGSALTFIRPAVEPPRLHFASPLISGVPESAELLGRLNDLNARIAFGRLSHRDDMVVAEMELICRPFVPQHVAIATNIMSRLADEADDILQGEFGGKTFFGDQVPPKVAERYEYGGYL